MNFNWKQIILLCLFSLTILFGGLLMAVVTGFSFGFTRSNNMNELLSDREAAVPTQILDRNGDLISELVGEQKRDIIYFHELPIEIVTALMSREDPKFFYHSGFSLKSTLRAILFLGKRGGGSTISQQTAGVKFCNRREMSIKRKIKELWYSFNMERDLSKEEIIQLYLNEVYFGHSAYGIEAASQFFFRHSARDLSLAESAIIVTPISNPRLFSPLRYPDNSSKRQKFVLQRMVEMGYIQQEQADTAFREFWADFDYNRSPQENYQDISSARNRAPYFTDYVRTQLQSILTGTADVYKDGYIIETTLDLDLQQKAEKAVSKGLDHAAKVLEQTQNSRNDSSIEKYIPIVDMLCLATNISGLDNYEARRDRKARDRYIEQTSPTISLLSLLTGNRKLQSLSEKTNSLKIQIESKTEIQTSMISIDNSTGRILTMIGGRDYDNQFETDIFNRSTMGTLMPGSTIKPLYYSAGISSRQITPATIFDDSPVVFFEKGNDVYMPDNYMDRWQGPVRTRYALKTSMNIPSIQILDTVGYDLAIERIASLIGMADQQNNQDLFPRKLPLALGIIQVAPINMARAFATFANNGVATEPHAIMAIKDRNGNPLGQFGNIGADLEQDVTDRRDEYRIMTPEEAHVMVEMLKGTVYDWGTLYYRSKEQDFFEGMPMGGKTGTTQNWADAWTLGFSPYMTTAVWFGFDKGNQSLGSSLTGASLAGRSWAQFMADAHRELPIKEFYKPETGIVHKQICKATGLIALSSCNRTMSEVFLDGTEPNEFCQKCAMQFEYARQEEEKIHHHTNLEMPSDGAGVTVDLELPSLDDLMRDAVSSKPGLYKNLESDLEGQEPTDEDEILMPELDGGSIFGN